MRAVHRLDEETRHLQADMEAESTTLLEASSAADYQRYLTRCYGFVSPLERCLLDTQGLGPFLDHRRLRKHLLIEHDLQTLGLKPLEIRSIPQCMWIPWFDNPYTGIGWAYIIERSTLAHPNLFRHLATVLPGEAAFAATYLKVYAGTTGEMWQTFAEGLDVASATPRHLDLIVDGAAAGYRHFRRWRNTLDGKTLSGPQHPAVDHAAPDTEPAAEASRSVSEES